MRRTSPQNRRYWALISELANKKVQGVLYSTDEWHEYLKTRFIGREELKLPNGKTMVRTLDSSNLSVQEFNDYMTAVEAWAGEHGVWLEQ